MAPRLALITALLVALPAAAADVWTTPYPGIRMLQRTTSRPIVFWAVVVDACAPGIRFRATAPSEGTRRTSSFGRLVGAQMAINGDFADHDFGLNMGNGQPWSTPDTAHSGNFSVGPNRLQMTADQVLLPAPPPWATEQLGGRWTLLENGAPRYGIDDNGPSPGGFVCAPGLRHPRTAIGLSQDKRKVILIVADGRSSASVGMTCDELIDVFRELGAHDAMGLDGGGSSTLWRNDQLINHPSDSTGERTVRNHLAIFAPGAGPSPHCVAPPPLEPAQAAPVPAAPPPVMRALTPPLRFTPTAPTRLFDTRTAAGSARLVRSDGATSGPLSSTRSGTFSDWASAGAPADAAAVWLNVTAVAGDAAGFLRATPAGAAAATSSLVFAADEARGNAVPVALGSARGVRFESSAEAEVIADLSGVFSPSTGAGFTALGPQRVYDSRNGGTPLLPGVARAVTVVAPPDTVAVTATVTAIAPRAAGYLAVFACGTTPPSTSNLNFGAGVTAANAVVSPLGSGQLCVISSAETDLVVDLTGAFRPAGSLAWVPLAPERVLDTRGAATPWTGRVGAGQVIALPLGALSGATGVAANVTALASDAAGFLTAFPCGRAAPNVSTLNFAAGAAVSGLAVTELGAGALCLVSNVRAHLVVDLVAAWVPRPAVPADAGAPPEGPLDGGTPAQGPGDGGDPQEGAEPVSDAGSPGAPPGVAPPAAEGPLDPASGSGCAGAPGLLLFVAARLSRRSRRSGAGPADPPPSAR